MIAAYDKEKDSGIVKRLMPGMLAERDRMQRTKAAFSMGHAGPVA